MAAFFDLLDDFGDERIEIAGISRGDDALIGNHGLVNPASTGIFHIGADRGIGRCLTAAQRISFDQQPRPMADSSDDLAGRDEIAHQLNGLGIGPQDIRIDLTTGNDQRIVIAGRSLFDSEVYIDRVTPVLVIPAFDRFFFNEAMVTDAPLAFN